MSNLINLYIPVKWFKAGALASAESAEFSKALIKEYTAQ